MMKRKLLRWFIGVVAIIITMHITWLLPKIFHINWNSWLGLVIFVPVLALTNAVLGTVLRLFSAPITCLTLGLFALVINAIVFWIAGMATGAEMGVLSPFAGSILYTAISTPLSWAIKEKE